MVDRRSVLSGIGGIAIGAFAGCASSDSGNGNSNSAVELINDRDTVTEDQYLTYELNIPDPSKLGLETIVRSGPRVDIVLTTSEELAEFERGNRFRYHSEITQLDTSGGNSSGNVEGGDYALIVDNTDSLEAQPPTNFDSDPARVEIRLLGELL